LAVCSADAVVEIEKLVAVFGLGKKEADKIVTDVSTKCYRNYLKKAVQDGSLDAAESKAAFLTVIQHASVWL
jgi:Holliday junction resolvasome RuvABC DNA-binding subunit